MKHKDIRNAELKGLDHRKLPVGNVVSLPVKGEFIALPLFGWVAQRDKVDTPLVMLTTMLLRPDMEGGVRGTFQIELPVIEETELATLAALERYGWDGRVWPVDDGWPTGSETDEMNLTALMESAKLRATMTFPPGEHGHAPQLVDIQRAKGPFLMPPLPAPEGEVDPLKLQRLRQLCENPRIFINPMKPAILDS